MNRVKTVVNGVTTIYIENYYEVINPGASQVVKKYYYAGGTRVAMSEGGVIRYFVTDHLGSTTNLINTDGTEYSDMKYLSWGSDRLTPPDIGTSFKYTGQREAEAGLYFYNARYYDPAVGRFIQADTLIPDPGNPIAWDRFAYVSNNPVNYTDPSGHMENCQNGDCGNDYPGTHDFSVYIPDRVDKTDNQKLTSKGQSLYNYYTDTYYSCGWWNDNCSDRLSLTEFYMMILAQELQPFGSNNEAIQNSQGKLEIAATHWFYDSCRANNNGSCSGPSNKALLSWMAGNLESAMRLIKYQTPLKNNGSPVMQLSIAILSNVLNPESVVSTLESYADLVHWGNASFYDDYGPLPASTFCVLDCNNPKGDPFYIISYQEEDRLGIKNKIGR